MNDQDQRGGSYSAWKAREASLNSLGTMTWCFVVWVVKLSWDCSSGWVEPKLEEERQAQVLFRHTDLDILAFHLLQGRESFRGWSTLEIHLYIFSSFDFRSLILTILIIIYSTTHLLCVNYVPDPSLYWEYDGQRGRVSLSGGTLCRGINCLCASLRHPDWSWPG